MADCYPKTEKPETIHLEVKGRIPTREEAEKLTGIKFDNRKASAPEVKYALKWFLVFIALAIFMVRFGLWVFTSLSGFAVLFLGVGSFIVAPIITVVAFQSLFKIFRKEEQELAPGVRQLHAVLSYKDCLSRTVSNGKNQTMVTAILEIDIRQTYICAEGYWFPYDYMPAIRICQPSVVPAMQTEAVPELAAS